MNWKRDDARTFYVIENENGLLYAAEEGEGERSGVWLPKRQNSLEHASQLSEAQVLRILNNPTLIGCKHDAVLTPYRVTCTFAIAEATDLETAEKAAALALLTPRQRSLLGLDDE